MWFSLGVWTQPILRKSGHGLFVSLNPSPPRDKLCIQSFAPNWIFFSYSIIWIKPVCASLMFPPHAWLLAPLVTPRQKYKRMQQQKSFDTLKSSPINKLPTPRWVCSEDFIKLPLWMLLKVRNCRAWRSKFIIFSKQKIKQKQALCVYLCVRGCVKPQFLWLTKIPVGVDKALAACVFKPTTALTFHKVFAPGTG